MLRLRYIAAIAAALAMTACGSDANAPAAADDYVYLPVTLEVGVSSSLNITSRAAEPAAAEPRRPLSWTGAQCVRDLRMYVFESDTKDGEYLYAGGGECADGGYRVAAFNNTTAVTGENEAHVYDFTPRLRRGKYYKFLAIGRDDVDCQEIPQHRVSFVPWGTKTMSDAEFVVGRTEIHNASVRNMLEDGHYPYITTEIFSGMMMYDNIAGKRTEDYIYVSAQAKGFQKHLMLHRAVAALWVYVTDIPTTVIDNSGGMYDGELFNPNSLRIHMETSSPTLQLNEGGDDEEPLKKCRMVGFIDFTNNYGTKEVPWVKSENDKYWRRDAFNFHGVYIKENSALIANYLIPYDMRYHFDEHLTTLHIQLFESVMGQYEFNCKVRCDIKTITDPVTGEVREYDGTPYLYPIVANCIYAIGSPGNPLSLANLSHAASRGEVPEIEMTCIPQ